MLDCEACKWMSMKSYKWDMIITWVLWAVVLYSSELGRFVSAAQGGYYRYFGSDSSGAARGAQGRTSQFADGDAVMCLNIVAVMVLWNWRGWRGSLDVWGLCLQCWWVWCGWLGRWGVERWVWKKKKIVKWEERSEEWGVERVIVVNACFESYSRLGIRLSGCIEEWKFVSPWVRLVRGGRMDRACNLWLFDAKEIRDWRWDCG